MRRRKRGTDPLASVSEIRQALDELRERIPDLVPSSEESLLKMMNAIRHVERRAAGHSKSGRPGHFPREHLLDVSRHLKAVLTRRYRERISLNTFIAFCLPILSYPPDLVSALEKGEITRLEASILARLTPRRLGMRPKKAQAVREEVLRNHVKIQGSQTQLLARVREILGESGIVSSETLAVAIQKVDSLLEVDPEDVRHLFFETMKELFYSIRKFKSEDLDKADIADFMASADIFSGTIHAIEQRIKARTQTKKPIEVISKGQESEKDQRPTVEKDAQGRIIYRFK